MPGVDVAVDKTELRFVALNGHPGNAQSLIFSISGAAAGTYYASAEPDANASFDTYVTDSSLTSMKVSLNARATQASVDGSIKFKLCKDTACATVVWSRSLPYHIRNYTVDTSDIKLSGYQGANTSITRAISPAAAAGDLSAKAVTASGGNWLNAQIDANGALALAVNGVGMEQGTYSGTVLISAADGTGLASVPVAMTLGSGFALPADASVDIGAATPASFGGSIALAFNGSQAPAWTVSSDKPWLVLGSSGGTGAATVGYTLDPAKLASIGNFASDTASVTFKAAGLRDAVYKVMVTKKLPEIIALTPNPVRAGQAAVLHLRGRGFQQMGTVATIKANGVTLGTGSVVSDTEAIVNVPAMAEGAYQLSIPVSSGIVQPQPVLGVASAAPMAAALIDSAGSKAALLFDAQRKALYTVDRDHSKLLRFRLVNGAWTDDLSIPVVGATTRIGLSLDGKTLYSTNGGHVIEERDPDTLAVLASYSDGGFDTYLWDMYDYSGAALPITNDGRIWFSQSQWSELVYFDTLAKKFGRAPLQNLLNSPTYAVSADGSRMFVNTQPLSGGSDDALRYDPATGLLDRAANMPYFGNIGTVLSRDGKYVLTGATMLYESATYRLIGQMPAGTGGYYKPALLSPDGSRVYAVATTMDNNYVATMVRLDVISTDTMTKIGEIPLPQGVNCTSSINSPCSNGVFTMSPFGDTIFWAGSMKIAVIPVPPSLGPPVSVARFQLVR